MNATDTLPHVAALDVQIKRCGNAQEVSCARAGGEDAIGWRLIRSRSLCGSASIAGVTIRVSTVANDSPNTMADARLTHCEVMGPPTSISAPIRSTDTPMASGNRPKPVVNVVRNTGRNRCIPVCTMIFRRAQSGCSCRRTLKVSMSTILLFTIMPARATMPMPVRMTENVWPVVNRPSRTPAVESSTDDRINKAW